MGGQASQRQECLNLESLGVGGESRKAVGRVYMAQESGRGYSISTSGGSVLLPGTWSSLLDHLGCWRMPDMFTPGTLGEGRFGQLALPPETG